MRASRELLGSISGIAATVSFAVLWAVAGTRDSEYSIFVNYLSDMGVGSAAWAFNSGAIIAGALGIPFALLGLWPAFDRGIAATAGVAMVVVASVFLMLVGVFTEHSDLHFPVSIGFFVSIQVALGFLAYTLDVTDALGRPIARITEAFFFAGVMIFLLGRNPPGETIAVMGILAWVLIVAVRRLQDLVGAPTS